MRKAKITDAEEMAFALQDEIRRTDESRYDHRLHGVLLVAQGLSCREVARLFGDAPRTVAYWVRRFEEGGFAGLAEGERPGRPRRISEAQLEEIGQTLGKSPLDFGLGVNLWDGKTLSEFIANRWGIPLGVRQSQRLFKLLGFRLRKPRPKIAQADPELQGEYKKTE
ncbi:MAG: helix-turn-helix domain-containing protein [Desulfobacteraceae bacterium]|nr:helix-turn-helix domain-containing protein [Desulfobacteraceae bacterium]